MKTTQTTHVTTSDASGAFNSAPLGDLTAKQYAALETVARLSPGYFFTVLRYAEEKKKGSSATHVAIRRAEDASADEAGLVGSECAQYYDRSKETEQVVKRVAHRVYRRSVYFY